MAEYSRNGHRSRMRKSYIDGGFDGMPDTNLLELYLSFIIPRRDVKPIAYELLNTFNSIDNVFSASIDELMQVDGIGKNTAIAMQMFSDVSKRLKIDMDEIGINLSDEVFRQKFLYNLLKDRDEELTVIITLNNEIKITSVSYISNEEINQSSLRQIALEKVLGTNSSAIAFVKFLPFENVKITQEDIDEMIVFRDFFDKIKVSMTEWGNVSKTNIALVSQIPGEKQKLL